MQRTRCPRLFLLYTFNSSRNFLIWLVCIFLKYNKPNQPYLYSPFSLMRSYQFTGKVVLPSDSPYNRLVDAQLSGSPHLISASLVLEARSFIHWIKDGYSWGRVTGLWCSTKCFVVENHRQCNDFLNWGTWVSALSLLTSHWGHHLPSLDDGMGRRLFEGYCNNNKT